VRKFYQKFINVKVGPYLGTVAKKNKMSPRALDKLHIAILVTVTLAVGIYIIVTTVLITRDGMRYIRLAQDFPESPIDVIKQALPFGYPFLIFLAHMVARFFSQGNSLYSWIYSAQSVTLLCRVLSLIPLYFIGKLLIGSRRSFWGLLILVMLPLPAEFGSDVIREWPYVLFLATAMAFLIYGARKGKWWMFAIAGLAAGVGHTIRPECAQVVIYGVLWLLIGLFISRGNISRLKAGCLALSLLIGFAIPATLYMKTRGRVLPSKLKRVISCNTQYQSEEINNTGFDDTAIVYIASGVPANMLKAIGKLVQQISENLMYFFTLPLIAGLYSHFRRLRKILFTERFFIFSLVILYLIMMISLHINHGYISRRHCMPMVVFTVFYIPVGLQIMARWLSRNSSKGRLTIRKDRRRWFFILTAIGFSICIAKLTRTTPLRWEKEGYLEAATWLKENTKPEDIIVVPDERISFYAERKGLVCGKNVPKGAKYIVKIVNGGEKPKVSLAVQEKCSAWIGRCEKRKRVIVYEVL